MSDGTTAPHAFELPFYASAYGETDHLMVTCIWLLGIVLVLGGVFYLHLHSVPDRMAHKASHTQLQLIGILTLIALLTHNNIFWIAAIIIAALNPPDLMTPLQSMARSLQRMSGKDDDPPPADSEVSTDTKDDDLEEPVLDTGRERHV